MDRHPSGTETIADRRAATLLQRGRNVWEIGRAEHVAVLVDAADYFGAVRAAMLQAERAIQIIGWDVDSRTPLVGRSAESPDGFPIQFGDFLDALAAAKPWLTIRILLWDYSVFFAAEREPLPTLALRWKRPPQIDLCLDDSVPQGSSHHQKIVVIDDSLAFAGGLDITIRRWDEPEHRSENSFRVDPSGKPYAPFHDVQLMVDGEAARKLGELARMRWETATCEMSAAFSGDPAPWPAEIPADLTDISVGIARTQPAIDDEASDIREAEQLFLDMIEAAGTCIYIESQYLTCLPVAEAISARLRARQEMEAVLICPRSYHGHFERQAMLAGRSDFLKELEGAGADGRYLVGAPRSSDGRGADPEMEFISIHSKVMIIDDEMLRIGSANLCNRSMGTDTECDLVAIAETDAHREGIRTVRQRLLGEHAGLSNGDLQAAIAAQGGSVVAALKATAIARGKLVAIDSSTDSDETTLPLVQAMADPAQPFPGILPSRAKMRAATSWLARNAVPVIAALLVLSAAGLSAAWAWTPLTEEGGLTSLREQATEWMSTRGNTWNLLAVVAVFVLAGFLVLPLVALIVATTALYGVWPGLGYAAIGAMSSAIAIYLVGRLIGHPLLRRFVGPRLNRISQALEDRGIMTLTIIRLLPVAPFSIVNLVAGALRVPFTDYLIGTFLGLMPGFAVMALIGRQISEVIRDPSAGGIGMLVGLLVLAVVLSLALQMGIKAFRKTPS